MSDRKRITRRDVAQKAGVSETTVSVVMNDRRDIVIAGDTRSRVLEAARELGYHPSHAARTMSGRRSRTLGVLAFWDAQTWFFAQMLNGIRETASAASYGVLLCNVLERQKSPEDCIHYYHEGRIDGVLYLPPTTVDMPGLGDLLEEGIPAAVGNGVDPWGKCDCIRIDYAGGIQEACRYMAERGFDDLVYVLPRHDVDTLSQGDRDRLHGFHRALAENPSLSGRTAVLPLGEDPGGRMAAAMDILRNHGGKRGFVACYWNVAHYLQQAALLSGLLPGRDILVLSGDRPAVSLELYPVIYGIELPFYEIGRESARLLIDRLEGRITERQVSIVEGACRFAP